MKDDRILKELLREGEPAPLVSAEEVSSYVSGSMDPVDREEFEAFMAACPEVQQWVNIAAHELHLENEEAEREKHLSQVAAAAASSSRPREGRNRRFNWIPFAVAVPACGLLIAALLLNLSVNQANSLEAAIAQKDAFYRGQLAQLEDERAESKRQIEELLRKQAEIDRSGNESAAQGDPDSGAAESPVIKPPVNNSPKTNTRVERPTPGGIQERQREGSGILRPLQALRQLLAVGGIRGEDDTEVLKVSAGGFYGTYVAPETREFTWVSDEDVSSWNVFIAEKGVAVWPLPGTDPEVITEKRFKVPQDILKPGHVYTWQVVDASSESGKRGPVWTFAILERSAWLQVQQKLRKASDDIAKIELCVAHLLFDEARAQIQRSEALTAESRDKLLRFVDAHRDYASPFKAD